jgi:hypothetical protein
MPWRSVLLLEPSISSGLICPELSGQLIYG